MKQQIRLIACSLLLLSPAVSLAGKKPAPPPQNSPTKITPDAAAFLDNALDTMRQHALHAQSVDWTEVRTEAFKRAGGAFNPIDTYPAIYWALVQLGDPGAHLRLRSTTRLLLRANKHPFPRPLPAAVCPKGIS
jgi:hypothetical protein